MKQHKKTQLGLDTSEIYIAVSRQSNIITLYVDLAMLEKLGKRPQQHKRGETENDMLERNNQGLIACRGRAREIKSAESGR